MLMLRIIGSLIRAVMVIIVYVFSYWQMLIEQWAPIVNIVDKDKSTPLHQAAMCGETQLCKVLVSLINDGATLAIL